MIHDFKTSVDKSEEKAKDLEFWKPIFERHFPDMESFEFLQYSDNPKLQKLGVDWLVHLPGGIKVKVDDKLRARHYPDIALEYWSSKEDRVRGWVCKPVACDYFLYLWPSGRSILLPAKLLRAAWRKHGPSWVETYTPPIEADNKRYTTVSVGVPVNAVCGALVEAMLSPPSGAGETVSVEIPDDVPDHELFDYLNRNDEWLPEELRGSA